MFEKRLYYKKIDGKRRKVKDINDYIKISYQLSHPLHYRDIIVDDYCEFSY